MEPDVTQPDLTQQREQAHALLDMLPENKLTVVRSLLEVMVEPLSRSLASAPVEDKEITQDAGRRRVSFALMAGGCPHGPQIHRHCKHGYASVRWNR